MARLTLTQMKAYFETDDVPTQAQFSSTFEALDVRYDSAVEYFIDDVIFSGGKIYVSLTDNNQGNTPASNPSDWEEVRSIEAASGENVTIGLGDDGGSNKLIINNFSDSEVASIDSEGNIYVVGIQLTDVITNTSGSIGFNSNADIDMSLGDSVGARKVYIRNESDVEVAAINSLGVFTGDGSGLDNVSGGKSNTFNNLVINGTFQIWQRLDYANISHTTGRGFTNDQYTADRWKEIKVAGGGTASTVTVKKATSVQGDPLGSKCNCVLSVTSAGTGSATTQTGIKQIFEAARSGGYDHLANGVLSFWAKTSNVTNLNTLGCYVYDGSSYTSSKKVLTTSWQNFTLSVSSIASANMVIGFDLQGTDTIYGSSQFFSPTGAADVTITNVQFSEGTSLVPFSPKSEEDEYWDCLPYCYSYHYGGTTSNSFPGVGSVVNTGAPPASAASNFIFNYPRQMRGSPNVTVRAASNGWGAYPLGGSVFYCNTTTPSSYGITDRDAEFTFFTDSSLGSYTIGDPCWVRLLNTGGAFILDADI